MTGERRKSGGSVFASAHSMHPVAVCVGHACRKLRTGVAHTFQQTGGAYFFAVECGWLAIILMIDGTFGRPLASMRIVRLSRASSVTSETCRSLTATTAI